VWACEKWLGALFTRHAKRDEWLKQYSRVFSSVEVNSTFYGLPSLDTIKRWIDSVDDDFRFVVKFPRTISHEKRLLDADSETQAFLAVVGVMHAAGCLGSAFLQLPPGFSGHHLEDLENYLRNLPSTYSYAVELRHQDFFDEGKTEQALNRLLAEHQIDRVILDSRPLFSAPPEDIYERESQSRKPRMPVHLALTGNRPILRLIGRNDIRRVKPWIHEWSLMLAKWMHSDLIPFVFTHTPDERYAPSLARSFHTELRVHADHLADLPTWPGEEQQQQPRQLDLF
jgi:uncharacterized protein YecE (DUF72 family)